MHSHGSTSRENGKNPLVEPVPYLPHGPLSLPHRSVETFYQSRYARGCDPNHSVSSPRRCSVRLAVIQGLMDVEQFRASVKHGAVPGDLAPPLAALWWDAKGDWTRATDWWTNSTRLTAWRFTPTCTAKRETWAMPIIGTGGPDADSSGPVSMPNGKRLRPRFWPSGNESDSGRAAPAGLRHRGECEAIIASRSRIAFSLYITK